MTEDTPPGHRILEILYEDHFGATESNEQIDDLDDKLDDVDRSDIDTILGNLLSAGFIEKKNPPKLSTEGVEVVLAQEERKERQKHRKREHRVNQSIKYLTIALVLVGGLQAVALNLDYFTKEWRFYYSLAGAGLIILAMIVLLVWAYVTSE